MTSETEKITERYARREQVDTDLYSPLSPSIYMALQEKERAIARLIREVGLAPVADKRVLEIGCGTGNNLLDLIRLGFDPANLVGNDLIERRVAIARHRLSAATRIISGDACEIDVTAASLFDVVYQSTVFSSILDDGFQQKLADRMWELTKPGGGILWYDFIFNNPRNPDVRGVAVNRIHNLFPHGDVIVRKITLAPPLSRLATKIHPSLYTLFNIVSLLRTHVLCWISKPCTEKKCV